MPNYRTKKNRGLDSPPYKVEYFIPIRDEQNSDDFVLLWEPELYIELYEYARLANSEGYPLADFPFFEKIEDYRFFKFWFVEHWKWFAVYKKTASEEVLAGITKTDSKKGFGVHFDTTKVSLDEALAYVKKMYEKIDEPADVRFPFSLSMSQIKARTRENSIYKLPDNWEDSYYKKDNSDNLSEHIVAGFQPQQRHFSRLRVAYEAFDFYQKLLEDTDNNDDLLKVYVAHSCGLFQRGGRHRTQRHYEHSLAMKIEQHRQIRNGTYVKSQFSYKGHPVDTQWETWIETRKTQVTRWRDQCIETFICLADGVFPSTQEKCEELEIHSTKIPNTLLDPFIKAAHKNKNSDTYQNAYRKASSTTDDSIVRAASFVYSRITEPSPFRYFRYGRLKEFGNGAIEFRFNDDFSVATKKEKLAWFDRLITQMKNICVVPLEDQKKKGFAKGTATIACDATQLLSTMRDYIEDDLWFNDNDNDPAEHRINFEVDDTVGKGIGILFKSISNK